MASKGSKQTINIEPAEEYRTRFMYCSIGATLMCLGVIVLVSGLVVYIISATGPNTYVNNMLFHHQHEYNNTYWPIIIAIILSSSGIAFITIAIVFTLLACFSHGRIEEHFNNRSSSPLATRNNRSSTTMGTRVDKESHEEERLISSPSPNPQKELNKIESTVSKPQYSSPLNNNQNNLQHHQKQQQQPPPPPQYHPYVPVPPKIVEKQASNMVEQQQTLSTKGNINTVGLPLAHHPKKVPPNGFSYLAYPEEIHIFHEYHHQRTSSNDRNTNHHHHSHLPPPPPPTRATVMTTSSRESVI